MLISKISFNQKIHFNYTDSTQASYYLKDIRKTTFDGDLMDYILYVWNESTFRHYEYE